MMEHKQTMTEEGMEPELQNALRNFRAGIHAWSEAEMVRPRTVPAQRPELSRWLAGVTGSAFGSPMLSAAAVAILAVAGIGGIELHHHQMQLIAQQRAAEQARIEQAKEQAAARAATALDDDKLLQHVDEDIAQGTPDAMEPLASLMRSSGNE